MLFPERHLEIGLSGFRLGNGIAKNGWLRFGSASQGIVRFTQSGFRCHHFWMFIFVAEGKCGHVGLNLGDVATCLIHQHRAGNARDRDQHIDVFASFFDLLKLTFQTKSIRFGSGQFRAEIL